MSDNKKCSYQIFLRQRIHCQNIAWLRVRVREDSKITLGTNSTLAVLLLAYCTNLKIAPASKYFPLDLWELFNTEDRRRLNGSGPLLLSGNGHHQCVSLQLTPFCCCMRQKKNSLTHYKIFSVRQNGPNNSRYITPFIELNHLSCEISQCLNFQHV